MLTLSLFPSSAAAVIVSTVGDGDRDQVLVARLAAGDDDAIGEVFDTHAAFVLGVARRVSGRTSVAEDVVQEVFAALWRDPARFDPGRGSLRAYLGVQAHHRAVDAVRSDARRRAREERRETLESANRPSGYDEMDTAMVAELVRQAIGRLPAEQRRAVELVFWNGRTYREVAVALGIPEGTAKSRLRLAQAKLSEWLAPLALETL